MPSGGLKYKCKPGAKWPGIRQNYASGKTSAKAERKETGRIRLLLLICPRQSINSALKNSTGKINPVIAAIHREYETNMENAG